MLFQVDTKNSLFSGADPTPLMLSLSVIAKLSPSSSPSWAVLILFPACPSSRPAEQPTSRPADQNNTVFQIAKIHEIYKGKLEEQIMKRPPFGLQCTDFAQIFFESHVITKYENSKKFRSTLPI